VNSTQLQVSAVHRRGSVEGERRLRRIARAGKQWKKTIGRTIDMEGEFYPLLFTFDFLNIIIFLLVYVYRLSLEWARLWADDRDSMNLSL
jgi:hypothetical protein